MNHAEIVERLRDLGMLSWRHIDDDEVPEAGDVRFMMALREYQAANLDAIQDTAMANAGGNLTAHPIIRADGVTGPNTEAVLANHQHCGCTEEPAEYRTLERPWGECARKGIGFSIDWDGEGVSSRYKHLPIQSWLRPIIEAAVEICVSNCLKTGRRFVQVPYRHTQQTEHITIGFVSHTPGWIGLAQTGAPRGRCNRQLWTLINQRYRPYSDQDRTIDQYVRLLHHETFSGHNMSLGHYDRVREDVMYPVIWRGPWNGLEESWPSYRALGERFDLTPITDTPAPPTETLDLFGDEAIYLARGDRKLAVGSFSPIVLDGQLPQGDEVVYGVRPTELEITADGMTVGRTVFRMGDLPG